MRRPMSSPLARFRPRSGSVDALLAGLSADPKLRERLAHVHRDEGRAADDVRLPEGLPSALVEALVAQGKDRLWAHQREAIDHALSGRNVVISTATSSGKSLCFQVPVVSSVLSNPRARALFVFPTNPLANDQEEALGQLLASMPEGVRPRPPVRLQGNMGARKEAIAASDPQIVLTNPEMVHLHLLPQHRRWERFWQGLEWIVIDEIHLYRGAFGGHLANLLRRIRRCAWRYGATPKLIAASATVGNPKALAEELCSSPFELVDRSTAPRGPRTTVLWKSDDHYLDEAVDLFKRALDENLQAILFARSRQLVERLVAKLEEKTGRTRVGLGVRAYRAGYKTEEREVIERGLRDGSVRGVVTTNALEVGIDIGSLDVCVIAGWPGSVMAMRQQAGRVGRRDRASAVFLVASENPLDAWLLRHPEQLELAQSEQAVIGRLNPSVLRSHLACAASEFPLWEAEIERLGGEVGRQQAADLVACSEARWGSEGSRRVLLTNGFPHRKVSLRSAGSERLQLIDPDGDVVGDLDDAALAREAHPGAIYLHQGRSFRVERVENGRVYLSRAPSGASTRVQGERRMTVDEELKRRTLAPGFAVVLAKVKVLDAYTGWLEANGPGRRPFARKLEPPIHSELVTEGLILNVGAEARAALSVPNAPTLGAALHGVEHLLGALASSAVLCDRDDLEGHSMATDDEAALVLFDRAPGGMGFAAAAYERVEELVRRAGEGVESCSCDDGCPECIHSGRCLRGNDELSKAGARVLLALARGEEAMLSIARPPIVRKRRPAPVAADHYEPSHRSTRTAADRPWEPSFKPGDRVEHVSFGAGVVLEVRPSGRVVVDFGEGNPRRITPGWLTPAGR